MFFNVFLLPYASSVSCPHIWRWVWFDFASPKYFTEKDTKSQRTELTCPRIHSSLTAEPVPRHGPFEWPKLSGWPVLILTKYRRRTCLFAVHSIVTSYVEVILCMFVAGFLCVVWGQTLGNQQKQDGQMAPTSHSSCSRRDGAGFKHHFTQFVIWQQAVWKQCKRSFRAKEHLAGNSAVGWGLGVLLWGRDA